MKIFKINYTVSIKEKFSIRDSLNTDQMKINYFVPVKYAVFYTTQSFIERISQSGLAVCSFQSRVNQTRRKSYNQRDGRFIRGREKSFYGIKNWKAPEGRGRGDLKRKTKNFPQTGQMCVGITHYRY